MAIEPHDLPGLRRSQLRAQADMFAAVAAHGTIIGTAREIALIEFFRGLVPKRYEVLTGAIAAESGGKIDKASSQLDVLVVDTLDYPTLLRTGDLAVVFAPSVLLVVESKSDLAKGEKFREAIAQVGRARLVVGGGALTALYCFGAPTESSTLRGWLQDVLAERQALHNEAERAQPGQNRHDLFTKASYYSAAALPDLILSDDGAIAIRHDPPAGASEPSGDINGKVLYKFYKTEKTTPTVVVLAAKALSQAKLGIGLSVQGWLNSYDLLEKHFMAGVEPDTDVEDLDITDLQPEQG